MMNFYSFSDRSQRQILFMALIIFFLIIYRFVIGNQAIIVPFVIGSTLFMMFVLKLIQPNPSLRWWEIW